MNPVNYRFGSSMDQRCRQAMHRWSHTLYDQRFIWFYHLIVAKVFEVIVSIYLNTLRKYLITNTNNELLINFELPGYSTKLKPWYRSDSLLTVPNKVDCTVKRLCSISVLLFVLLICRVTAHCLECNGFYKYCH